MKRQLQFKEFMPNTKTSGIWDLETNSVFAYCKRSVADEIMDMYRKQLTPILSKDDRERNFGAKVNLVGQGLYPMEMLMDFREYWTEMGENDKKFRFEKERSFDIAKRLVRWEKNSKGKYAEPEKKFVARQSLETITKNSSGWGI